METQFIVTAESASIDQSSNNLSIHNIFEDMRTPLFPAGMPMTIVARISRRSSENSRADLQLRCNLSGHPEPLFDHPIAVDFAGLLTTRIIAKVQLLIVPSAGRMQISILHKGKELGHWIVAIIDTSDTTVAGPMTAILGAPVRSTTIAQPTRQIEKASRTRTKKRKRKAR
jgi:hypothetical protein